LHLLRRPHATVAALIGLLGLACGAPPETPERIVLIVVDTLRRDHLGVYGGSVATPRIDALAARGQAFGEVRAAFHQTTMSMGSLFTGRTPSLETEDPRRSLGWNGETWCGMARFAPEEEPGACLPGGLATLGERIHDAGYWTIGVPSNQFLFGDAGFSRGFDDWIEVGMPQRPSEIAREERDLLIERRSAGPVLEAVDTALDRRPKDRFFLYVHLMDVHDYHYRRMEYATTVAELDGIVGALLDALDARGLLEGATVILTADHGERLDETHRPRGRPSHYGNPAFEEMLAIPLIVAPPVAVDPTHPLRTQDLHALILRIAGAQPEDASGLTSDEQFLSERAFRTYVRGRWKSTVRRSDDRLFLYDLENDPGETRSFAAEQPEVAERQRRRIDDLSRGLAVPTLRADRALSDEERRTLEALGYVE
jgi:arylsulfatase A-like enzyme